MQTTIIAPHRLKAAPQLPASKSISARVLIINALAGGKNKPNNLSDCDDTQVMLQALQTKNDLVDIMAAGTAMRFLTAYFAAQNIPHTITGTQRMQQRPIQLLVDALRTLGAQINYTQNKGYPPLSITPAKMHGGTITLPGNVSSQYISALLMIGPTLTTGLKIQLTGDIISKPYIDMTLRLMTHFGAQAQWQDQNTLNVDQGTYTPQPFYIENDWSAASYWYQMVALSTDPDTQITLTGLTPDSIQGDSTVAQKFAPLGVKTTYHTDKQNGLPTIKLTKQPTTAQPMNADLVEQPDLAQTFAVTCALSQRPFHLTGLQSLKIKETDRLTALVNELKKLGYNVTQTDNSQLTWDGTHCKPHTNPVIQTYQDHRMAMAFAPAALRLPQITIDNPQVVSKSYPQYWKQLSQAGFQLLEQ